MFASRSRLLSLPADVATVFPIAHAGIRPRPTGWSPWGPLVDGALGLLESGVAVVIALTVVGMGTLATLGGSPQGGGLLLPGFLGFSVLRLALDGVVLCRVVVVSLGRRRG